MKKNNLNNHIKDAIFEARNFDYVFDRELGL